MKFLFRILFIILMPVGFLAVIFDVVTLIPQWLITGKIGLAFDWFGENVLEDVIKNCV